MCQRQCARSSVRTTVSYSRPVHWTIAHCSSGDVPLPLPSTATVGGVYIDDLVILTILHFRNVRLRTSPLEVQRAYAFSTIISRCLHTQVRQVQHSRESFGEDASVASQAPGGRGRPRTPSVADAHYGVHRCRGRESDSLATALGRLGVRSRVQAGSVRLSRRVQCCSCKSASSHTAPGERRSA